MHLPHSPHSPHVQFSRGNKNQYFILMCLVSNHFLCFSKQYIWLYQHILLGHSVVFSSVDFLSHSRCPFLDGGGIQSLVHVLLVSFLLQVLRAVQFPQCCSITMILINHILELLRNEPNFLRKKLVKLVREHSEVMLTYTLMISFLHAKDCYHLHLFL